MICDGKLPKPDYSVMVDVERERESTWEYVYKWTIPKLKKAGIELKILKTSDYVSTDLFLNDVFVLPAHRYKNGQRLKMQTLCNGTWKTDVTKKYIRDNGVKDFQNWIGISKDEKRRGRPSSSKLIRYVYPLIDKGITRYGCIDIIRNAGWKVPPHTACWCCPNATNDEWLDLKLNHPKDWEKAIALEKYVRSIDSDIYLHCSMKPLDEAFS
jgi:hypothetical protein